MTPKEIVQNHIIRQVHFSNDEISAYFQPRQNYENACIAEGLSFYVEEDTMLREGFFWWEAFSTDELLENPNLVDDRKYEAQDRFNTEQEAWKDCAKSNQLICNTADVLAVWLVSDWLYDQLERQNESVINWRKLPLWGRTSIDHSFYNDPTIEEIAINY